MLLAALFVVLPPLQAFAVYFVCVHAPAHAAGVIGDPVLAPRVTDGRSALVHALPITLLTVAVGAALWPLYGGPGAAAPALAHAADAGGAHAAAHAAGGRPRAAPA